MHKRKFFFLVLKTTGDFRIVSVSIISMLGTAVHLKDKVNRKNRVQRNRRFVFPKPGKLSNARRWFEWESYV